MTVILSSGREIFLKYAVKAKNGDGTVDFINSEGDVIAQFREEAFHGWVYGRDK